ncbi:MAG: ABC transporter permease [Actinomycetota bacterium]|nr:ABC transporter permease [Actinomycetota bacterium]
MNSPTDAEANLAQKGRGGAPAAGALAAVLTRSPWWRRHPIITLLVRRLVAGVFLVLGVTVVAFILTNLVPGDPAAAALGQQAINDPQIVANFRHQNGLDQPVWVQFFIYLGHLLHGDLGTSLATRQPVSTDLGTYLPATIELALVSIVISLVIGLTLGLLAALWRHRWPDGLIRIVSLIGVSVPTFWLALTAVLLISVKLDWLPTNGQLDPTLDLPPKHTGMVLLDAALDGQWATLANGLAHIILPALVLAAYTVGLITRFTRASVLEVLGNDYVRAARAKGLPERTVILRHVVRPALVPIITVSGLAFGSLLSGTVLVEQIFSWPGIGQYAFKASIGLDLPAVMGVSIVIAVVYVIVNLLVDVLYGIIDPRIRQA